MIYLDNPTSSEQDIETLLSTTRSAALSQLLSMPGCDRLSGSEFERLVFNTAESVAIGTALEGTLRHTNDREFPDIIAAGHYGIEVKATKKNHWHSIGNSVLESSRVPSVNKIYMFFGKLGGTPDIKYRNYEDCLTGISVTHYPRYQIDMLAQDGQSIFHKIGASYDEIRTQENPIGLIRSYYKRHMRPGDALWWIDDDGNNIPHLSPIIRNLSSLTPDEKDVIKSQVMAFFPEVFSNSSKKYERIPAFLASQHGVVTTSLRDMFSAGGQQTVTVESRTARVPQIIKEMERLAPLIRDRLTGKDQRQLTNYWQKRIDGFDNPYTAWAREINKQSRHMNLEITPAEIFFNTLGMIA